MTTVLRIDTSIFGAAGASTQLNTFAVEQLRSRFGNLKVSSRDLHREPLPHLTGEVAGAIRVAPAERDAGQQQLAQAADEVIEQALAADIWLIGAPMYNFGMPSALKAWFDYVLRAGVTFKYTSEGPLGLIAERPVIITASRGGVYPDGAGDHAVPHVRSLLSFVGLKNPHVVYADALDMGQRETSLAAAQAQLTEIIQQL